MSTPHSTSLRQEVRRVPGPRARRCFAIAACALLIAGCAKEPTRPKPIAVNSDPPTANARIMSQKVLGGAEKSSVIWHLEPAGDLSTYYFGRMDDKEGVGMLDASGSLRWHVEIPRGPVDITALSATSPVPGGAVVVSMFDTDGDNLMEKGEAALFTSTGTIGGRVPFATDTSDVWIQSIATLSDSDFVVVGGERTSSGLRTLVARLALTAAGTLEKREQMLIVSLSGRSANDVAVDPEDEPGPVRRVYLSTRAAGTVSPMTLHALDLAVPGPDPPTVLWTQTLQGKGVAVESDMHALGGALFVAGHTQDPDKPLPPGGASPWSSGLVARLSHEGAVDWEKVVTATNHSDLFYEIEPTATAILAIGGAAAYASSETHTPLGYGWVERLSPATGEVLSCLTFGDPGCSSVFFSGRMVGESMLAGGWTQFGVSPGKCRAWLCTLNMSGSGAPTALVPRAPVRPGEGAFPAGDRGFRDR